MSLLVVAVGLLTWVLAAAPAQAGAAGSGWLSAAHFTTGQYSWQQDVATAPDGSLVVVYISSGFLTPVELYVRRSTDGGRTWDGPHLAVSGDRSAINPAIAIDPVLDRTFIAYEDVESGSDRNINVTWSDDLVTWTNVNVIDCLVVCEVPDVAVEYWNGGSNAVFVSYTEIVSSTDQNVVVFRSTDNGQTFPTFYVEGNAPTDLRFDASIATQLGDDGVGRVFVAYRWDATDRTATEVWMIYTEDQGGSWQGPNVWGVNLAGRPSIAAAKDGLHLAIAWPWSAANSIFWEIDQDVTVSTAQFDDFGSFAEAQRPWIAADGDGLPMNGAAGNFHLITSFMDSVSYMTAPVSATSNADWTPRVRIDDAGPNTQVAQAITTQERGGTWYPVAVFLNSAGLGGSDGRATTPGARYTFTTVPGGLDVLLDGSPTATPVTLEWVAGTVHTAEAPTPIPVAAGERLTFLAWDDAGPRTRSFNIDQTNQAYEAQYATEYQITLQSIPGDNANIRVDGSTATQTPFAVWLAPGPHTFEASAVALVNGFPYDFGQWEDGSPARIRSYTVNNPAVLSASYVPSETSPPVITHTPVAAATTEVVITIEATVTDETQVASVELFYKSVGATAFSRLDMTNVAGDLWTATIPAQTAVGTVEYYIEASDGLNEAKHPTAGATDPHRIQITQRSVVAGVPDVALFGLIGLIVAALLLLLLLFMRKRKKEEPTAPPVPPGYAPAAPPAPWTQPPPSQPPEGGGGPPTPPG